MNYYLEHFLPQKLFLTVSLGWPVTPRSSITLCDKALDLSQIGKQAMHWFSITVVCCNFSAYIMPHISIHLQQHHKTNLLRFSHILLIISFQIFWRLCTVPNNSCPSPFPTTTFFNHSTVSFRILIVSKWQFLPSSSSSVFSFAPFLNETSFLPEDIVYL